MADNPLMVSRGASLLDVLLEGIPTAAALIDADMKYVLVNRAWMTLVSISPSSPQSLVGQSHALYFPEQCDRWPQLLSQCELEHSYSWQEQTSRLSNRIYWTARRWQPSLEGGGMGAIASTYAHQEGILLIADELVSCPLPPLRSSRQIRKEQIIHSLSSRIHQLIDLHDILQTTVTELRQFLQTDRVLIYQFHQDWSGTIVVEAAEESCLSVLGTSLRDPCFSEHYIEPYRNGRIHIVNDVRNSNLLPCYLEFLQQFQVQANLVAPIISNGNLWGLICIHECRTPREWQPIEMSLVEQIATHTGIAIQQAALYQQLQQQIAEQEANLEKAIADRLSQEKALRQSEQRRSLLFEQAPIAVIELDCSLHVKAWNPASEQIFGYSSDEAIGCFVGDLILPSSEQQFVDNLLSDLISKRKSIHSENVNLTKDGRSIICEWYDIPLIDEAGNVIGIASMGIDITHRKEAEDALRQSEATLRSQAQQLEQTLSQLKQAQARLVQTEKMSSLGRLVAGVAHEINNPVNFIYGNLSHAKQYLDSLLQLIHLYQTHYPKPPIKIEEAIAHSELDYLVDDFPRILSSIQVGAERIRQIVSSLRNFSRLDEAESKYVDIHEGLESTLMILKNRLKAKPGVCRIRIDRQYGELPPIHCFPGQLNQVFMNILSNAIDALEEQRSQLEADLVIRITTQQLSDHWISIGIADNGPGIPPHLQQRMFDPFFTTKPPGKGTGLGLSISYQIVTERHGGVLHCRSEIGQGTEFFIEVPTVQPEGNGKARSLSE